MKTIWSFLLVIAFTIISFNSCSNQRLLLSEESEREQEENKIELTGLVNYSKDKIIFTDTKGIQYHLNSTSSTILSYYINETVIISANVVTRKCIDQGISHYLSNVEVIKQ